MAGRGENENGAGVEAGAGRGRREGVHDGRSRLADRGGVPVLRWADLESAGAEVVTTTRHGGVSEGPYATLNLALHVGDRPEAVLENRRRAARSLDATLEDLVFGAQVHGTTVSRVGSADRGRGATDLADALAGADALVTAEPGPVLVTMVADCTPIVLVHPEAKVLATVHAGWRGTVGDVVGRALEAMASLGAAPSGVTAAIGPSISAERYQVSDEVGAAVRRRFGPDTARLLRPDGPGHWRLDLPAANRLLLRRAGVPEARIVTAGYATDDQNLFFSDRAVRPCGRFGLLARLRP